MHPYQRSFWTSKMTFKEKAEMLNIDVEGGVEVMLALGEINAQGGFKWMTDEKVD